MNACKLTDQDARDYIFAGNATVTFKSLTTGKHFTYKVKTPKQPTPGKDVHFVALLNGPDNEYNYCYMGTIFEKQDFRLTAKSRVEHGAMSVHAFRFVLDHLTRGIALPPDVEVWHEGSCGRCGRKLTVPESIQRGIGPECAGVRNARKITL